MSEYLAGCLLHRNLGEALQKLFQRHAALLKEALAAASDANKSSSPALCSPAEAVASEASIACQPAPEEEARPTMRQLLYEEVRLLHEHGMHITAISRKTGLDRKTVRKYLQVEKLPDWTDRRGRGSILDPYRDYLQERVTMGCHNAAHLFRELKKQGYKGKATLVRDYVASLEKQTAPGKSGDERRKQHAFSPNRCSWLVLKRDEKLTEKERQEVEVLRSAHSEVAQAMALVETFAETGARALACSA